MNNIKVDLPFLLLSTASARASIDSSDKFTTVPTGGSGGIAARSEWTQSENAEGTGDVKNKRAKQTKEHQNEITAGNYQ